MGYQVQDILKMKSGKIWVVVLLFICCLIFNYFVLASGLNAYSLEFWQVIEQVDYSCFIGKEVDFFMGRENLAYK